MRELNAPPEKIREMEEQQEDTEFVIYPENWNAWKAFLTVATQWSRGPMGAVDGLDYQRVEAGLRMAQIKISDQDFLRLQVIEAAIIKWIKEKQ